MEIKVDCYAGYRGEETPRWLRMGARRIAVVAVQDRWLAPDHRYFKIIGDDGGVYIIRHDPHGNYWELTCFKQDSKMDQKAVVDTPSRSFPVC
jgi:hypothetical protein